MSRKKYLIVAICLLAAFALWTVAVSNLDVRAIGPEGSAVGFAGLNGFFHALTGVHMELYQLTDLLSLIPLLSVPCFGFLGLSQWLRRKSLMQVDRSVLVLGGLYLATLASFLFFENYVINYRPVLIDGVLEASYPSSTTMLVLCVMPATAMQLKQRLHSLRLRRFATVLISVFTAFMVIGRLISGVHWFTDIVGGILLGSGLVMLYAALAQ